MNKTQRYLLQKARHDLTKAWNELPTNDDLTSRRAENFIEHAIDLIDEATQPRSRMARLWQKLNTRRSTCQQ